MLPEQFKSGGSSAIQQEFKSWQIAFGTANTWQRDYWLMDWLKELRRLDYLTVLRSGRSLDDFPMLEIVGKYDIYRRNTEMVMLDVRNLWQRISAEAASRCVAVENEEGFEFFGIAHVKDYSVSVRLRLSCTR